MTLMAVVEDVTLEEMLSPDALDHLNKWGVVPAYVDMWQGLALFGLEIAEQITGTSREDVCA